MVDLVPVSFRKPAAAPALASTPSVGGRGPHQGPSGTGTNIQASKPALLGSPKGRPENLATRALFGSTGIVPCLLTTASTAVCALPFVDRAVAWSRSAGLLRGSAALLGAHTGVAVLSTGLVLATFAFAVAQLVRQRLGASDKNFAALAGAHLPQLAMGLALAPTLVTLSALTGPAGLLAVGACLGLTCALAGWRSTKTSPSLMGAAALLSSCLLVGPAAWSVACGMAAKMAVAQSVGLFSLALSAVGTMSAGVHKMLESAPTPYFDTGVLQGEALAPYRFEAPDKAQLEAPGSPAAPTIFDVNPELWTFAKQLQQEIGEDRSQPFLGFKGQPVHHLHGPPGGGKTRSTLGFAREIGAVYRSSDANQLEADNLGDLPIAAINACLLLLGADAHGRKIRRPVVLLLDEVDAILPSPGGEQDNARINKALGFNLLVQTLRMLQRNGSYVVLFTATNRYAAYAPMLQLLGQNSGIYLDAPTPESKRKVFRAGLREASLALQHKYNFPWVPLLDEQEAETNRLMARCQEQGALSLRSMANLSTIARDAAVGEASRQARLPGAALDAQKAAVVQHAFAMMHAELDEQQAAKAQREPKKPQPKEAEGAEPPEKGEHAKRRQRARDNMNLDRLLQETGLRDTSMVRIFQTITENVAQEYPKPENAVRFATIQLRLANVFWLTLLHLARSTVADEMEPLHHQVYVPPAREGESWLPSPTGLLTVAWRAAKSRFAGNATLRKVEHAASRALRARPSRHRLVPPPMPSKLGPAPSA